MNPQTVEEWFEYIASLPPEDLFEKARVANTLEFVQVLRGEGLPPKDITRILKHFGARLLALDMALPGRTDGAYLDYASLMEQGRKLEAVESR